MEEYKMIFQVIAFIFILIMVYYGYRFIIYSYRNNRLSSYTIKNKKKDIFFDFIDKISKKMSKYNFYKNRVNKYDKYFNNKNKFNSSHIITLKILMSIILILIYIFDCMIYKLNINLIIFIIMGIIGYNIIDIILSVEYNNKVIKMDNNLTRVMIVMNNNYRVNKNHKEVMERIIEEIDEPLKSEFIKVKTDLIKGIDISSALYRMYERTNLEKILFISELLGLNVKYGISIIDICNTLEKSITKQEKRDFYVLRLNNTNKLVIFLLAFIPLFVVGLLMIMNYEFIMTILLAKYLFLIFGELVLYLFYLFIMLSMIRGEL